MFSSVLLLRKGFFLHEYIINQSSMIELRSATLACFLFNPNKGLKSPTRFIISKNIITNFKNTDIDLFIEQ
jgi:hypothetical protein